MFSIANTAGDSSCRFKGFTYQKTVECVDLPLLYADARIQTAEKIIWRSTRNENVNLNDLKDYFPNLKVYIYLCEKIIFYSFFLFFIISDV